MWRHIPKIVVLSAIGLLMVTYYVTRGSPPPAQDRRQGPGVVYINPDFGAANR